jgi:phosphatidylinositol dimannoside acyltransferase
VLRPDLTLATFKTIATLAQVLPGSAMQALADVATAAIPAVSTERRIIVERNLARSNGRSLIGPELDASVKAVFRSYARYYTDTARLPGLSAAEVDRGFSYHGFRHIEDGVAAGKGTILVLPHVGGWEWAGSWLAKVPGYAVTAVVEPLANDALRVWMQSWRESVGMHILPLGPGLGSELLRRLRANHVVCLMSDRNLGDGGVEVDFFGEPTELPGGAATLALRTGATIVPVAVYHRGPQNHAICEPPVAVERQGRMRADIARITQDIAAVLEMQIRREPEQWIVLQPNWPSDVQALRELRS